MDTTSIAHARANAVSPVSMLHEKGLLTLSAVRTGICSRMSVRSAADTTLRVRQGIACLPLTASRRFPLETARKLHECFEVSRFRGFWLRGRTDDRGQKTKDEGWSMRNDIQPNPLSSVFCLLSGEDFQISSCGQIGNMINCSPFNRKRIAQPLEGKKEFL